MKRGHLAQLLTGNLFGMIRIRLTNPVTQIYSLISLESNRAKTSNIRVIRD